MEKKYLKMIITNEQFEYADKLVKESLTKHKVKDIFYKTKLNDFFEIEENKKDQIKLHSMIIGSPEYITLKKEIYSKFKP